MDITQSRKEDTADLPVPPNSIGHTLAPASATQSPSPLSGIGHQPGEGDAHQRADEARAKFAEETHQYIREYIRLADQKATFYFAGTTALLAFLYKTDLLHLWLKTPKEWIFVDVLSFIASAGLVVSALACILAVKPNLTGSMRGLIFFRAINQFQSGADYSNEVMTKRVRELTEAKLCHVFDLSSVCTRKYDLLNVVVIAGIVGVASAIGLLFLSRS